MTLFQKIQQRRNEQICWKKQIAKTSTRSRKSILVNEIEFITKQFSTNRTPGPDDFTDEFYQTFMEEITRTLHKIF